MDIVDQMAADIAMKMNGGEWTDGKWYSQGHRDAWVKAVQPYADKIERLQKRDGRIRILDGQIIARNAEIKRLRKVLQQIADKNPFHNQCPPMNDLQYYAQVIVEMVTIANAELKESE